MTRTVTLVYDEGCHFCTLFGVTADLGIRT